MTKNRMFAFGSNVVNECPCPATKAGFNPDNDSIYLVAEAYDDIVRSEYQCGHTGVVDESIAQEAWEKAIQRVKNDFKENSEYLMHHSRYCLTQAKGVQDELGRR